MTESAVDPRSVDGSSPAVARYPTAAFHAGAALLALDQVIRADPPWLGVWRMRQALAASAAAARHLRLRQDTAALRDACHLGGSGGGRAVDPGPAGRLHRLVREFARRPTRLAGEALDRIGAELGRVGAGSWLGDGAGHGGPIADAAALSGIVAARGGAKPDSEVLAWMAADAVLADRLGWTNPAPLLATVMGDATLARGRDGRRVRPDEPGWEEVCHFAYARAAVAAHRSAQKIASQAARLAAASERSRTRGVDAAFAALMADDAVAATVLAAAVPDLGSDRAARRLLERLVAQGGLRELTGRPTFRLYGL